MKFDTGGKEAIERLVEAYGVDSKVALANKLGISASTLGNRYARDTFPADYVIQCALETGASLKWLATGTGIMFEDGRKEFISIEKIALKDGILSPDGFLLFDPAFFPSTLLAPQCVVDGTTTYIIDKKFPEISNGKYLIDIEGKIGIHDIDRIPVKRIRISGGELKIPIDCGLDDVDILAKVTGTFQLT